MATPVPTLVGKISETASDGTIAIPNTTPPAVGDYLVAFIGAYISGGSRSVNTPAGWTIRNNQTGDTHCVAMYTKTADSSDVAAGSFTFTISGTCDVYTGAIVKLTNIATGSEIGGNELDTGTTSFTATTNIAATTADSLVLAFYTDSQNNNALNTTSAYASTPSLTWTELVDEPAKNGSVSMSFAIASAPNSGTSSITNREATLSATPARTRSIVAVFNGLINATGTNALLAVSPLLPTQNGVAGAQGTNTLHSVSPSLFAQSGNGTSPTQWTPAIKSPSIWTPQPK